MTSVRNPSSTPPPDRNALAIQRVSGFIEFATGKLSTAQLDDLRLVVALAARSNQEATPDAELEAIARKLCEARGENPVGEQVRFVDGGMHSATFLGLAKRDVQVVLAAKPVQEANAEGLFDELRKMLAAKDDEVERLKTGVSTALVNIVRPNCAPHVPALLRHISVGGTVHDFVADIAMPAQEATRPDVERIIAELNDLKKGWVTSQSFSKFIDRVVGVIRSLEATRTVADLCPCGGELTEYRLCKVCGGDVALPGGEA